jgi:hypothetical protein
VEQSLGPRVKAPSRDAFDSLTLKLFLLYLGIVSLATHLSHQGWLGFFLAPVPLLFYRLDNFRFLILCLSCYLVYFECFQPASNFLFFNVPDSLFILFVVLKLFNRRDLHTYSIPMSPMLLPLYLFLAHGFAMSIHPYFRYGIDFYVMRDVKNLVYLSLAIFLSRAGEAVFNPGKIYRLLLFFVSYSALHSCVILLEFIRSGERPVTWNEVFLADGVLMAVALLPIARDRLDKRLLYGSLILCAFGLLATQTRGLWLSTLVSLGVYFAVRMGKSGSLKPASLLKWCFGLLLTLAIGEILLRISVGMSMVSFIHARLTAVRPQELIDPSSSLGYRIHESLVVWGKRSFFGHGSGARLYLYFTQLGLSKFINWWSIHSEYFELLHKYGFFGLGLFMWFIVSMLRRSLRIARSEQAFVSAMGFIVLTTVLNHCVVSITSGYLIRENVMLWLVLMVGIAERYYPRVAVDKGRADSIKTGTAVPAAKALS